MKKTLCVLLVLVTTFMLSTSVGYAHQTPEHNSEYEAVLFNGHKPTGEAAKTLEILELAIYLCIDQAGIYDARIAQDQPKLDKVRSYVGLASIGMPSSIKDINPDAGDTQLTGTNHRQFTHRGWDHDYTNGGHTPNNDKAHWLSRKNILLVTANKIFGFQFAAGNVASIQIESTPQLDSFCAVMYYIHVLGDFLEDENYKQFNGQNNGLKIPFASEDPKSNPDIFSELVFHIKRLFPNTNTNDLTTEINELAYKARMLVTGTGINEEKYPTAYQYAVDLMNILTGQDNHTNYMYTYLKKEPFFKKVFY